jgi:HK97 family phage major capsid protein
MKERIKALREQRAKLAQDYKAILDSHPITAGAFPAEKAEKCAQIEAEMSQKDDMIDRCERASKLDAEQKFNDLEAQAVEKHAPKNVYNSWLRNGWDGVSREDIASIRNTMSTTTGSEGGFTVPTTVASSIADALKMYGGMRAVSDVIRTSMGNDMNFPTSDGRSEVGELIAQNTTATAADPIFGSITLATYKFSSKIIAVPFELLQDTVVDMEGFIRQRIVDRLGRITNQLFTTGTGTGQPRGVVTAASAGKVGTTGQTTTVIYDDIIDLVHSVDPAYRQAPGKVGFMAADASVKVLRKIKDTAGRPIWTPSYDLGATPGAPDSLVGYPIYINQDIPVMAANAKSILFGNYNYYKIRDVMDMTLFRFTDSAYTKLGQVGFLAWMRAGGNFVDVGGGVAYYQNSAT